MPGPEGIWRYALPGRLHRVTLLGLAARDVGPHKAPLDRPGAEEGSFHDQVVEGLRLRLREQVPLAGALDLEDGERLAGTDEAHGAWIGWVGGQVIDVGPPAGRLLDERERLLDGPQRAQAQQVELDQPQPLDVVLIDLQGAHPLGRNG